MNNQTTKSSIRHATVLPLVLMFVTSCNAAEKSTAENLTLWDSFVTAEFFQSFAGPGEFSSSYVDGKMEYVFVYEPPSDDPGRLLSAAVAVSVASSLLDRAEYDRAITEASPDERARDFPSIGARARTTPPFFAPDGSTYGVVSTTKDERFDLSVNVLEGGAATDSQVFDPLTASVRLHEIYQSTTAERKVQ